MRPDFFSWLTGLSLCLAPVSASANDVEINAYLPPIAAPLIIDGPACPGSMDLRRVQLDTPGNRARFDTIFTRPPTKKTAVRRAGQLQQTDTDAASHPHIRKAYDHDAHYFRPVDLHLSLNMRLCSGVDTIKIVDGVLSITGQIGLYDISYTTAITVDPDDALYLYWKKKPRDKPAPHTLGQLILALKSQPFDARHPQTGETLQGSLRFTLDAQITTQ